MYKIPKLKSDTAKPGPKGITAYPNKEKTKVIIGPRKNNIKFACVGLTYSFNINFNASATMLTQKL